MILELAGRSRQVEASEFVFRGERYLAVPVSELESAGRETKPANRKQPSPPHQRGRKVTRAAKSKRTTAAAEDVSASDAVRAALAKGPLASGAIIAKTGLVPQSVYCALTVMRKSGEVETRVDEADGERKNFLKKI